MLDCHRVTVTLITFSNLIYLSIKNCIYLCSLFKSLRHEALLLSEINIICDNAYIWNNIFRLIYFHFIKLYLQLIILTCSDGYFLSGGIPMKIFCKLLVRD